MKTLKFTLLLLTFALLGQVAIAQVVISDNGTTSADPNAVLELKSDTKALLLPRLDPAVVFPFTNPVNGLIFVGEDSQGFLEALYFYHKITGASDGAWHKVLLQGVTGLGDLTDVKTTINPASPNAPSYYIGLDAGPTTGVAEGNLVIGASAGKNMDGTGIKNTVIGFESAENLESGKYNTFVGNNSGPAFGVGAGAVEYSTAIGVDAETQGNFTTALGPVASANGTESIAIGRVATTGQTQAISIGSYAEASGKYAVALGHLSESDAESSVAIGYKAKVPNSTDNNATAVGGNSTASAANSTALGANANVNHSNSTAIGYNAVTNSDNQIMLGANEKVFIPGLILNSNTADAGDLAVYIDPTTHQLTQGPALPNKGLEESEIIRSLQQENKELRQRLEKLEAIVEELAKQ